MYEHVYGHVCVSSGRGEKRVLGRWELEFQAVLSYSMWFWDLNPSPSERAMGAVNLGSLQPLPFLLFLASAYDRKHTLASRSLACFA